MTEIEKFPAETPAKWNEDHPNPWIKRISSDFIRNGATILAVLLALSSLTISLITFNRQLEFAEQQLAFANEQAGNASWDSLVEVAIQNADLAKGLEPTGLDPIKFSKYEWFIQRLLFAGEQILWLTRNSDTGEVDAQWERSIEIEVLKHLAMVRREAFLENDYCTYRKELRNVLISAEAKSNLTPKVIAAMKCPEGYD